MKKTSNQNAQRRPLALQRETIAELTPAQLRDVAGGLTTASSLTTRTQDSQGGG